MLETILQHKRIEIEIAKVKCPIERLMCLADTTSSVRDFVGALKRDSRGTPAIIAEVKKASPSRGLIRADFNPTDIAKSYQQGGASAISVLTDERFFQGSLDYLTHVRDATVLPVLRKDFVLDEYQIWEARANGADAVLLIVAALGAERLQFLLRVARNVGIHTLTEVHSDFEMEIALETGAEVIGINNRDLSTFQVDIVTTTTILSNYEGRLRSAGARIVSESGIFTREDMLQLGGAGVDAVLIGEALMREPDIESKLRGLLA